MFNTLLLHIKLPFISYYKQTQSNVLCTNLTKVLAVTSKLTLYNVYGFILPRIIKNSLILLLFNSKFFFHIARFKEICALKSILLDQPMTHELLTRHYSSNKIMKCGSVHLKLKQTKLRIYILKWVIILQYGQIYSGGNGVRCPTLNLKSKILQ